MSPAGCPRCNQPLVDARCAACEAVDARVMRRELVGLIVLAVIVVIGFLLTRAVAAANRARRVQDAAAWYALARDDHTRDRDGVLEALRRATALDRGNVQYRLELADALAEQGDDEAARQLLVDIREAAPESPDVNMRLARLAARGGHIDDATRYYQNAIHGVWRDDEEPMPRLLRLELIRYLLAHERRGRALAELIALSETLPASADAQLEIASLLREAGDPARALALFRRVLERDDANAAAREGAGIAAFEAGDYAATTRYVRGLTQLSPRGREVQAIAGFVVSRNPLRRGLTADERRRRMRSAIGTVLDRLESCAAGSSDPDVRGELDRLGGETHRLESLLRNRRSDLSDFGDGLARLAAIEQRTAFCGPSPPADEALLILARQYEAGQ